MLSAEHVAGLGATLFSRHLIAIEVAGFVEVRVGVGAFVRDQSKGSAALPDDVLTRRILTELLRMRGTRLSAVGAA